MCTQACKRGAPSLVVCCFVSLLVQVPDPPLLRQETEASHAYLSMLLHLASSSSSSGGSSSSSLRWAGAADAQQATKVGTIAVQQALAGPAQCIG